MRLASRVDKDMKRVVMILTLASVSVLSSFGQDATAPHSPAVMKRFTLKKPNQVSGDCSISVASFHSNS